MTNNLAYYNAELITTVKSFTIQAHEHAGIKCSLCQITHSEATLSCTLVQHSKILVLIYRASLMEWELVVICPLGGDHS